MHCASIKETERLYIISNVYTNLLYKTLDLEFFACIVKYLEHFKYIQIFTFMLQILMSFISQIIS